MAMHPIQALLREWDATLAALAAILFAIFVGSSDRSLEVPAGAVYGAVTVGATVGGMAFVASRWLNDRLSKDEYGTLVLAFDPDESMTQRPYRIMTSVGFLTALYGVLLAVTLEEFSRSVTVALYAILLGLVVYCILGSFSLISTTYRHQQRASLLRAMKEDAEREDRLRKKKQNDGGRES
jgi:hypothetical protein